MSYDSILGNKPELCDTRQNPTGHLFSIASITVTTRKNVRICKRYDDKAGDDCDHQVRDSQERVDYDRNTADGPYKSRESMGVVPVFLVIKRPGKLYANGVISFAFWQIVSAYHNRKADNCSNNHNNRHFFSHCHKQSNWHNDQRNNGDEPFGKRSQ